MLSDPGYILFNLQHPGVFPQNQSSSAPLQSVEAKEPFPSSSLAEPAMKEFWEALGVAAASVMTLMFCKFQECLS